MKKPIQSVSKIYQEQLKPAHAAAVHAQQLASGIQSVLTQQPAVTTQQPGPAQLADDESVLGLLAGLGNVKLPVVASSYRCAACFPLCSRYAGGCMGSLRAAAETFGWPSRMLLTVSCEVATASKTNLPQAFSIDQY